MGSNSPPGFISRIQQRNPDRYFPRPYILDIEHVSYDTTIHERKSTGSTKGRSAQGVEALVLGSGVNGSTDLAFDPVGRYIIQLRIRTSHERCSIHDHLYMPEHGARTRPK
jgi:hypothetical protein